MALFHNEKPKLTPKDFVLYAATMIALYVSVFAVLSLAFEYINYLFPDTALSYTDPYSTSMRAAIATLLVMFPLYVGLTRATNQDLRKNPEKQELGFRKWLIYITLLIGALALVIDLILLVNGFLGGDLTVRFALKVVAVFAVIGGAVTYYVLMLKGYWEDHEKESKLYGVVVVALVFLTIIGGFFIMGSPQAQRELKLDQEKVSDLQRIQWEVINYWQTTDRLPNSLEELSDPLVFTAPNDPQTGEPYDYENRGELTFALCAEFNRESTNNRAEKPRVAPRGAFTDENWEHPEGYHCFERTINPERFPNREASEPSPLRAE